MQFWKCSWNVHELKKKTTRTCWLKVGPRRTSEWWSNSDTHETSSFVIQFLVLFTATCEHLAVVGNAKKGSKKKNNNNVPKKDYHEPKWVPAKLALIVRCRQNSCLSENPCCCKPKCFYFGSFSLDHPDCCCYNNNTSMFNSLQCRDNTSDSHNKSVCVCLAVYVCVWVECEFLHVSDK